MTPEFGNPIPLDLRYTAAERDRALREGIPVGENLNLPAGMTAAAVHSGPEKVARGFPPPYSQALRPAENR